VGTQTAMRGAASRKDVKEGQIASRRREGGSGRLEAWASGSPRSKLRTVSYRRSISNVSGEKWAGADRGRTGADSVPSGGGVDSVTRHFSDSCLGFCFGVGRMPWLVEHGPNVPLPQSGQTGHEHVFLTG
jgi:hypothetical protein